MFINEEKHHLDGLARMILEIAGSDLHPKVLAKLVEVTETDEPLDIHEGFIWAMGAMCLPDWFELIEDDEDEDDTLVHMPFTGPVQ